jgi:hypothetical protein
VSNSYRDLQAALTQFAQCISVLAGDDRTRHEVMVEESRPILKAALAALASLEPEKTPVLLDAVRQWVHARAYGGTIDVLDAEYVLNEAFRKAAGLDATHGDGT